MKNKYRLSLLKKYKISNSLIAEYLGYSSEDSFNNSSSKDRIKDGLEKLIRHVETTIKDKI